MSINTVIRRGSQSEVNWYNLPFTKEDWKFCNKKKKIKEKKEEKNGKKERKGKRKTKMGTKKNKKAKFGTLVSV